MVADPIFLEILANSNTVAMLIPTSSFKTIFK
jgi:hypothetical protein